MLLRRDFERKYLFGGLDTQWIELMLGNFAFITSNVDGGDVDQVKPNLSAFPSWFYTV